MNPIVFRHVHVIQDSLVLWLGVGALWLIAIALWLGLFTTKRN